MAATGTLAILELEQLSRCYIRSQDAGTGQIFKLWLADPGNRAPVSGIARYARRRSGWVDGRIDWAYRDVLDEIARREGRRARPAPAMTSQARPAPNGPRPTLTFASCPAADGWLPPLGWIGPPSVWLRGPIHVVLDNRADDRTASVFGRPLRWILAATPAHTRRPWDHVRSADAAPSALTISNRRFRTWGLVIL